MKSMEKPWKLAGLIVAFACVVGAPQAQQPPQPQEQAKVQPPPAKAPKSFDLPRFETVSLANGLKATLVPFGRAPKATIRAVVVAGRLNDGDTPFIADLTAAMMQAGAGGKSGVEVAAAASRMGGDIEIGVDVDEFFAEMDVLSENAAPALALLADVLQRPTFPDEEFNRIHLGVLRTLAVAEQRPQHVADDALYRALFPNHPYGLLVPDRQYVAILSLDQVKAFHAANFGAQRTHIYIVGRFKASAVKKALEEAFGAWETGPAPLARLPESGESSAIHLIDRPTGPFATVRLGKRIPAPGGAVALEAANTLIGGSPASRASRTLGGYAQGVASFINARSMGANWQENAEVLKESAGTALKDMLDVIASLEAQPPGEAELEDVKNHMTGSFVLRLGSREGVARELAAAARHGLGADYLDSYVNRVAALTPADVQAAAREHLAAGDMSIAVVGDMAAIRPQLEALPEIAGRLPPVEAPPGQ